MSVALNESEHDLLHAAPCKVYDPVTGNSGHPGCSKPREQRARHLSAVLQPYSNHKFMVMNANAGCQYTVIGEDGINEWQNLQIYHELSQSVYLT